MPADTELVKKRAPTLTAIITIKMVKAGIFLALALGFYALSDNNLQWEFSNLLRMVHLDGSRKFFLELATKIASLREGDILWVAGGTLVYGALSLTEGVGLVLRLTWASWLAMSESALLIPVEVWELGHHFTITLLLVLITNLIIVSYLFANRNRLFHHHLHAHH
jgi:uncharacterized membrane protein (DUF2068 family)